MNHCLRADINNLFRIVPECGDEKPIVRGIEAEMVNAPFTFGSGTAPVKMSGTALAGAESFWPQTYDQKYRQGDDGSSVYLFTTDEPGSIYTV